MQMTQMVPLKPKDRVLAIIDGKITECYVAEVSGFAVKVTRNKDDEGTVFERDQIFPLYRKVKGTKTIATDIGSAEVETREFLPLFDVK
jgi:hypothetical protein